MPPWEDWRIMLTLLITGTLEVSSILHVALIIYLRLMAVIQPMRTNEGMIAKSNYLLIAIWVLVITNNLFRFIFFAIDSKAMVGIMDQFNLWVLVVTPVILIILFYVLLVISVWKKKNGKENTFRTCEHIPEQVRSKKEKENARTTKIVMRLVMVLLLCYTPYISLLNGLYSESSNAVSCFYFRREANICFELQYNKRRIIEMNLFLFYSEE